jgi:hypothetical protein
MDHPHRAHGHVAIDDIPVKGRKQRRRGRAVEASVVEEDLEDARQAPRSYITACAVLQTPVCKPGYSLHI